MTPEQIESTRQEALRRFDYADSGYSRVYQEALEAFDKAGQEARERSYEAYLDRIAEIITGKASVTTIRASERFYAMCEEIGERIILQGIYQED